MAATPFPPPPPNASFDIFNDAGAVTSAAPSADPFLPGGPCNFVDLTQGPNGPKCGCRRFWSRRVAGAGNYTVDQTGWCMCSHHACFHDDVQNTQGQPAAVTVVDDMPGQENEKPRLNRAPLSPVQDFSSFQMPNSLGGAAAMDFTSFNYDSIPADQRLGLDLPPASAPAPRPPADLDSMPDTLSWKNVLSTQGVSSLPPIPSQCLLPESQSASTTASSSLRYLRPFGGQGLNTLSSVPPKNCDQTRDGIATATLNRGAQHVPTPGGQTIVDAMTVGSEAATPTAAPTPAVATPLHPPGFAGRDTEIFQNLSDAVDGHERRIDKLESGSIYSAAHEECSDKHDLADLRVTELETRMDDVEKRLNDDTTSVASSRRITQRDDDATISVVSAPALASDRAALTAQVAALQTRVNQLSASSLPSYGSPWELEVVFLPFHLKGIWQAAQDFKTPRLSAGRDEWTQLPSTHSRATPDPHTFAAYEEWAGEESGWLLPRACVPGRMIDQRLRSRGLIKTVSVRGGDARSVQLAVGNAFESILRLIPSPANPRSPYASDARVDRFFGLQQSWVPLRKVHKDARLRFLSPAELLTPVLWNATFLMDSVVMKATGIHRLYITQPEAYLQDSHLLSQKGSEPRWTWQRLRELTRVYPDSQGSNDSETPEADALEEYWQYNARLDEPSSTRLPSASPQTSHEKAVAISRTSDGSTQQFFTGPSNLMASTSPVFSRGQSPLIQRERRGSRAPSFRTGSVPPVSSPLMPSPRSSRRVSSYAMLPMLAGPSYQRHSSPLVPTRPSPRLSVVTNPHQVAMVTKHRQRATRSPSVRLQHTPRYSHRSYSRSPSVTPLFQNVYVEESMRGERRVTPFAYATPFSNAPPEYPPQRMHNRSLQLLEDEDEDMPFDDDHGSSTDDVDDDLDVDVYEDENDMLDNLESESGHRPRSRHESQKQPLREQQEPSQPQRPEDEVWPGFEDNVMSDGENVDPFDVEDGADVDNRSDTSSVPSEYPSTQRAWRLPTVGEGREMTHGLEGDEAEAGGISFHIHEDDDDDQPRAQNQW